MKSFSEADLSEACAAFAVANTPLFLLRKLRKDPAVLNISRSFNAVLILDEFKKAVLDEPKNLEETVRPYVYAVALANEPSDEYLREAAKLELSKWDWLEYLIQVLLETYTPTNQEEIWVPGAIVQAPVILSSDAPFNDVQTIVLTDN
jgi:hypothetical protein